MDHAPHRAKTAMFCDFTVSRHEGQLWVISGCAGPSAALQVNLNKRTPPREPERAYLAIRHPAG